MPTQHMLPHTHCTHTCPLPNTYATAVAARIIGCDGGGDGTRPVCPAPGGDHAHTTHDTRTHMNKTHKNACTGTTRLQCQNGARHARETHTSECDDGCTSDAGAWGMDAPM